MTPEAAVPPDPLIGKVVCGCHILDLICRGGMGRLYRARQVSLDRIVAVKVLSPALGSDEEFLGRFRREARALANLHHPNIVAVHDFGEEGDVHAIVMEYVEGQNVADSLVRAGALPIPRAVNIVRQVADGLAYAHERNIIHCDVKPENILVNAAGVPKLADFGLAKSIRGESGSITRDGVVLGTPTYMSPEQCSGGRLDARTDIYSLGATFYRMVAGRDVFEGNDAFSIMLKHQNELPEDPRRYNPAVPNNIAKIILRMMEKAREARYQAAMDVVKALTPFDREGASKGSAADAFAHPHREFAIAREAVEAGLVSLEQLHQCIERQTAGGGAAPDLPVLFVEEGLLAEPQVQQLAERARAGDEAHADEEFARLALEAGLATKEQVSECARKQKALPGGEPKRRLGRTMAAAEVLKPAEVAELLMRQLKLVQRAEDAELLDLIRREGVLGEEEVERCIAEQQRREGLGRMWVLRQIAVELGLVPAARLRELLRKKMRHELLQYLGEREKSKADLARAIIPREREIKLEEEEPCPVCKGAVQLASEVCPHCGAALDEARRQVALDGAEGPAKGSRPRSQGRKTTRAVLGRKAAKRGGEEPPLPSGDLWQVRLPTGEASAPLTFDGVLRLLREDRVKRGTVLRGPLTLGVWRQAQFTPKLCRLFGACHYCGGKLSPDAAACPNCKADPDRPQEE